MLINLAFAIYVGNIYSFRQLFGIELFAVCLTLILFKKYGIGILGLSLLTIITVAIYSMKISMICESRNLFEKIYEDYDKSPDGKVFVKIIEPNISIAGSPAYFYLYEVPDNWELKYMQLYAKERYNSDKTLNIYPIELKPYVLDNDSTLEDKAFFQLGDNYHVFVRKKGLNEDFLIDEELNFLGFRKQIPMIKVDFSEADRISAPKYEIATYVNNLPICHTKNILIQ